MAHFNYSPEVHTGNQTQTRDYYEDYPFSYTATIPSIHKQLGEYLYLPIPKEVCNNYNKLNSYYTQVNYTAAKSVDAASAEANTLVKEEEETPRVTFNTLNILNDPAEGYPAFGYYIDDVSDANSAFTANFNSTAPIDSANSTPPTVRPTIPGVADVMVAAKIYFPHMMPGPLSSRPTPAARTILRTNGMDLAPLLKERS